MNQNSHTTWLDLWIRCDQLQDSLEQLNEELNDLTLLEEN